MEKRRPSCVIVPVKTINKRLPGKTFREINGKPLYSYLFDTLKKSKSKFLDEVYIDSSDERVLNIANWEYDFKTIKRPVEYNEDNVAGDQLIKRIIESENIPYDIIGWVHITSPFLKPETLKNSIELLKNDPDLDSVFGIVPRYNRFWYNDKPLNHDLKNLLRTQDLTPLHEEADFYFFRKNSFIKYQHRVCGNYKTIEIGKIESVDIDNLEDLFYAEAVVKGGLAK